MILVWAGYVREPGQSWARSLPNAATANLPATIFPRNGHKPDEHTFTLRQVDQARGTSTGSKTISIF
jgi:hypothetical protein